MSIPADGFTPRIASLDHLERDSHASEQSRKRLAAEANEFELAFQHRGQATLRNRIRAALETVNGNETRILRWDDCGRFATVERSLDRPGVYRVACSRCRDRFCPSCGRDRSRIVSANVVEKLRSGVHRFVTLTVRHGREPLRELIEKLEDGFKKLRRTSLWRTTVRGGIAFMEVKRVNGWHPHLHCIVQGSWIDQKELKATWKMVTGDSDVVDVRLVRDARETGSYVAKYASKPLDRSVTKDKDALQEAIVALKGVKLIRTFGDWRGFKACESMSDEAWDTVASIQTLMAREWAGDPEALEIMAFLRGQLQWEDQRRVPEISAADG